jgi:heat shock protein HspQ
MRQAEFSVGQLIRHRMFDYRGVIFDVDANFQGSDDWYEKVAKSRPPKDRPWYHVLVDGAEHTTYVAERHLRADSSEDAFDHPLLEQLFQGRQGDHFVPTMSIH